ncbi:sugar O-acetyltransferase [Paucibacter sp. B2R-40]|uniref:sugar O-acetyltransferase n=1 Tax=Paucibacter sp. B2R-40 TaxID=2893554 RepID=UPI0021E4DB0D|nr:sugar O-acetyltransferase [Paucibacter sp. B2R-40]MCV2356881.1 sugar O-acetyltransferase [Paucibacter sp. B2R-40]
MSKTEKEKMLAGEPYSGADPQLVAERLHARELCRAIAELPSQAPEAERSDLLKQLFGAATDAYITPPFFCDYGRNIELGKGVYFNFNCVLLDCAKISIGDHVLFGPAVQIYTASHPMDAAERRSGLEFAKPIAIGNDVWLGGGVVVCPGVTIGAGTVIGAGSVVLRDIPAGVLAAGNPCRVIREL